MTRHTPHAHQEEAIELALSQMGEGRSNGCLIGDEPGAGKTTVAAEVILRAGWQRALIIALPDTHTQWADRLAAQSDGETLARICNGTSRIGRENFEAFMKGEPGIYVAGADFLRQKDWEMREIDGKRKSVRVNHYRRTHTKPLDGIIFDECHAIANKKSKTRATVWSIKANFRLAMSGTWARNDPANMWSVAKYVWPGEDPTTGEFYVINSFGDWSEKYLTSEVVYANGRAVLDTRGNPVRRMTGEKIPGEFVGTLPAYRRLENEDRVPEAEVIYVKPTPEQEQQLADLEQDFLTWVVNWEGEDEPLVADIPIVLQTRMRQACIAALSFDEDGGVTFAPDAASAKLGPIRGLIEGPFKEQPVAIYTDSKIGAHFIAQRMRGAGLDARAWTGDLSKAERVEFKRGFLAGEFDYIVATVQSFGTGLDGFQLRCNKVIWVSEANGDNALNEQAIARFFRPGRMMEYGGFAHVKLLLDTPGSPDVHTFERLLEKGRAIRAAMTLAA